MKLNITQAQYAINAEDYNRYLDGKYGIKDIPVANLFAQLTKEIDIGNSPIPRIGEKIADPFWPRDFTEQKVVDIVYSYDESTCYITLEAFVIPKDCPLHKEFEKIANSHKWQCQKINLRS